MSKFKAVLAPDFSPYGDMPLALQIYNHYRKHWCARYWQEHGIITIPTIRASTDPRSFKFFLDGEPEGGVVAISSMWAKSEMDALKKEFDMMVAKLQPAKVLVYGRILPFMESYGIPLIHIPDFAKRRFSDAKA